MWTLFPYTTLFRSVNPNAPFDYKSIVQVLDYAEYEATETLLDKAVTGLIAHQAADIRRQAALSMFGSAEEAGEFLKRLTAVKTVETDVNV